MPGATFSSTLRFSTIASGGTRPWAISARPSSRSLPWRHELTMVSAIPGEDHVSPASPGSFPMSNFRPIDRQTGFLLPPSVDEWLPEKHLARFVVEVIDGLDLSVMRGSYRGSGSASYPPSLLLGILVYGYATGVFSSRKLERASYDSVAFRFIAANQHPDHDTIAAFRRRFLQEIEGLFVQVLAVAREMGVLQRGTGALDPTKLHPTASRHSALSYEHAGRIEA